MKKIVIFSVVLVELGILTGIILCTLSVCTSIKLPHSEYAVRLVWLILGLSVAIMIETELRKRWHI